MKRKIRTFVNARFDLNVCVLERAQPRTDIEGDAKARTNFGHMMAGHPKSPLSRSSYMF